MQTRDASGHHDPPRTEESNPFDNLAEPVLEGSRLATARALTHVEQRSPGVEQLLATLFPHTGRAHVIGVTGPPGSGKSTLVNALTTVYRGLGRTVGILAVDPSSSRTGGAILGDRVRMASLDADDGVFIRSIATRGALGGLSRTVLDAITVLDAAGKDIVIVETVGVGQAEIDVVGASHSVVVVSVPGLGDDVQAIKAGLLEIADVHVVNKSDRPGAHRTASELRGMMRLFPREADSWAVPVRSTVAETGSGVAELIDTLDAHSAYLTGSGERLRRLQRNVSMRIRWLADELVLGTLQPGNPAFDEAVEKVVAQEVDPATAMRELLRRITW